MEKRSLEPSAIMSLIDPNRSLWLLAEDSESDANNRPTGNVPSLDSPE